MTPTLHTVNRLVFKPTEITTNILEAIGVPKSSSKDGVLDSEEANQAGVDIQLLIRLALKEKNYISRTGELSFPLASLQRLLRGNNRAPATSLFRKNDCANAATTAPILLDHLRGRFYTGYLLKAREIESKCSYTQLRQIGYSPYHLRGVFFTSNTAPSKIVDAAKSVVQIVTTAKEGVGSAVITSDDSSRIVIMTNYHVLYDSKKRFIDNSGLLLNGHEYRIMESNVFLKDAQRDVVKFQIPELTEITDLPIIKMVGGVPKTGSIIWHVGFPLTISDVSRSRSDQLVLVSGKVSRADQKHIISNGYIKPGMSGGGVFNEEGELIALNQGGSIHFNFGHGNGYEGVSVIVP